MDLDDVISQEILDQGIQVPDKKQIIGLYHGKIYAFQPDGLGYYHGYQKYPKTAKEVAKKLGINIKQIKNIEI